MSTERDIIPITTEERKAAVGWLRSALSSALVVTPISQRVKRPTQRAIDRAPDWLMVAWAIASDMDLLSDHRLYLELADRIDSDLGKAWVRGYVDSHDVVAMVKALQALLRTVLNLWGRGTLPIDQETVQRQVLALAMAGFMPGAEQFAQAARAVLSDADHPGHLLVDYRIALEQGDKQKLRAIDDIMKNTAYDVWVAERLNEARRWLGVEPPHFNIIYGERTPQWDSLWGNIVKGGN